MPSLIELLHNGLNLAVAFQLVRPLVRLALQSSTVTGKASGSGSSSVVAYGGVELCPPHLARWHPFSADVFGAISAAAPEGGWPSSLSLELLSLFWSLSMYDIMLPKMR